MASKTVADILREIRGEYYHMEYSNAKRDIKLERFAHNLADRLEAAYEREVAMLRVIVETLARVILPEQEEYPVEYGGGKVPDKNEWLGWVRAMRENAKSALGEKGGNDGE